MKKEIDFSNTIRNPYIEENLNTHISLSLNSRVIDYFKEMAEKKVLH